MGDCQRSVSTTLRQALTKFSEFFMCWVFRKEISRQDRLATTIANSVDPQHPSFCPSSNAFRFSKLDRCGFLADPVVSSFQYGDHRSQIWPGRSGDRAAQLPSVGSCNGWNRPLCKHRSNDDPPFGISRDWNRWVSFLGLSSCSSCSEI